MRVWDRFLTEQDRKIYAATDYGARSGLGSRPALVVIDVSYAFTGDVDEPILEAMKKWRTSCGSAGWRAIPAIQELLESARRSRVPVFFSTGVDPRPDGFDRGAWSFKRTQSDDDRPKPVLKMRGNDIVEEVAPLPHEFVIEKLKPSVFHGTPLLGYLVEWTRSLPVVPRHRAAFVPRCSMRSTTTCVPPWWRRRPSTASRARTR